MVSLSRPLPEPPRANFGQLPQELLDEVCQLVPRSTLRSLRSVNRPLSKAASRYLFRDLHLYPMKESFDWLGVILKNPALRDCVQSITYWIRGLPIYSTIDQWKDGVKAEKSAVYVERFRRHVDVNRSFSAYIDSLSDDGWNRHFSVYCKCRDSQTYALSGANLVELWDSVLALIPQKATICLTDSPLVTDHWDRVKDSAIREYFTGKPPKLAMDTLLFPRPESLLWNSVYWGTSVANHARHFAAFAHSANKPMGELSNIWINSVNEHFFHNSYNASMKEVEIPVSFADKNSHLEAHVVHPYRDMIARITNLGLFMDGWYNKDDTRSDQVDLFVSDLGDETPVCFVRMSHFLSLAQNLKSLKLQRLLRLTNGGGDLFRYLPNRAMFPGLRELYIEEAAVRNFDLERLLRNHQGSLKRLTLEHINLSWHPRSPLLGTHDSLENVGKLDWMHMFKFLRSTMSLDAVELGLLTEAYEQFIWSQNIANGRHYGDRCLRRQMEKYICGGPSPGCTAITAYGANVASDPQECCVLVGFLGPRRYHQDLVYIDPF